MFLSRLLRRRPPATDEAPAAQPDPATVPFAEVAPSHDPLESILSQIEEDVILTMRVVGHTADDVRGKVDRTIEIMDGMREASVELSELSTAAFDVATGLADTTRHLEQTGEAIEAHIAGSDEFIADAQSLAGTVTADMDKLAGAVERIAGVVAIIGAIARQTNLLALNASIEAARAGAAGRGFAVVATEVKALAGQVQAATNDISDQIVGLQGVARGSGATVSDIARLLERVGPVMSSVRDAVRTQIAGAREVADKAGESLRFVSVVSKKTDVMTRMTAEATAASRVVSETAARMTPAVQRLSERSAAFLHYAEGRGRRQSARLPIRIAAAFRPHPGSNRPSADLMTLDLSVGGGLTEPAQTELQSGDTGTLSIQGIGDIDAVVRSVGEYGIHFAFPQVSPAVLAVLQSRLVEAERENRPAIKLVQALATAIAEAFAEGVAAGQVTMDDLITFDYRRIPGTEPIQYETAALPYYEAVLGPLLERYREECPARLFLIATDRNSYAPLHEPGMSLPQRPGQAEWNDMHCRNRRIFDRSTFLLAARNQAPFQLSAFMRHMPDGSRRGAKKIAAPVKIDDRLWGNVVLGLPL
ncbi:MAG: methyl-accepting chemotaxis protein [Burkholderiales bacterium]|nr:methyl-accepting chemotaxis protein [Burkholderiales bacterium]